MAGELRDVIERLVATAAPEESIRYAADSLERLGAEFDEYPSGRTYEGFADAWPQRSGDSFTDKINAMPKHVASRTLTETTWNASVIEGDAVAGIAALKEQPGGDLLKYGTGELDRALLENGLVDELHFWVFPVLAGGGQRLIEGIGTTHLKLVDASVFSSGIVVHVLEPK